MLTRQRFAAQGYRIGISIIVVCFSVQPDQRTGLTHETAGDTIHISPHPESRIFVQRVSSCQTTQLHGGRLRERTWKSCCGTM